MMLTELFRSTAHEAGRTPSAAQEHFGNSLLNDSLIFIPKNCFYIHEKEAMPTNMVTPDQAGLLLVLNDLFLRQPDRFGSDAQRMELKKEIESLVHTGAKRGLLLGQIANILERRYPGALKDVDLALVGMDDAFYLKTYYVDDSGVSTGGAAKLLVQFGKTHTFNHENRLHLGGALDKHANTKVDYAVTGNVLNDPHTSEFWDLSYIAAAKLLKKGGSAIHLVSYSTDFYEDGIASPEMVALAGQHRVGAVNGKHSSLLFTLFDQVTPCLATREHFIDFSNRELIRRCNFDGEKITYMMNTIKNRDPQIEAAFQDIVAISYPTRSVVPFPASGHKTESTGRWPVNYMARATAAPR